MSNHFFNPFIAKNYGVTEAIFIDSFIFWTRTNASKDEDKENNFFEGRFWCWGTPEYFAKYFFYLTERQIQYCLKKLVNSGVLLKGNFNKKGYDKTNWYSLSDKILNELNLDRTCLKPAPGLIEQICPMDRTNLSDGSNKFVRPIPDTKSVTKQNNKREISPTPIFENEEKEKNTFPETYYQTASQVDDEKMIDEMLTNNPYKIPEIFIRTWFATRKAANKPINSGIWALTIQDLYKYSENGFNPIECFERMVKNGWLALDVKKELDNRQSKRKVKSDTNSTGYLNSGFLGV